jgi:ATP-dependent Clp protease protease subunit
MGTIILAAGAKGKRYALPNSTIHMHQPMGGAQGQAADIEIAAREILRLQDVIRDLLVKHTGQPLEKIISDTDRDFYMNSESAMKYGVVDEILKKGPAAEKGAATEKGAVVEKSPAAEKGAATEKSPE